MNEENINREDSDLKFQSKKRVSRIRIIITIVIMFALVVIIILSVNYLSNRTGVYNDATASPYYAVFLANGQVYFGKILSNGGGEITMSDIYYLQSGVAPEQTADGNTFSLIKLGRELHGPTDKLYINKTQVLFYEQLRNDSKVVQSILSIEPKI